MNSYQKGSVVLAVLGIIVVVLVGGGAYYYVQTKNAGISGNFDLPEDASTALELAEKESKASNEDCDWTGVRKIVQTVEGESYPVEYTVQAGKIFADNGYDMTSLAGGLFCNKAALGAYGRYAQSGNRDGKWFSIKDYGTDAQIKIMDKNEAGEDLVVYENRTIYQGNLHVSQFTVSKKTNLTRHTRGLTVSGTDFRLDKTIEELRKEAKMPGDGKMLTYTYVY
jgi:hypothetical protein